MSSMKAGKRQEYRSAFLTSASPAGKGEEGGEMKKWENRPTDRDKDRMDSERGVTLIKGEGPQAHGADSERV